MALIVNDFEEAADCEKKLAVERELAMLNTEPDNEKKEKRLVDRKYIVFYLRVFDGMSRKVLGHLVDISQQGIMMISDNPIEVNETLRLRMSLPAQLKDASEVLFAATSRWCKQDENPDFYLTGFFLHDIEAETENVIRRLIDDFGYVD